MLASADDVAWTMAVLAGGMAFARLLSGGGRPASQPAAAAAGPSHFQPCPVQTALLFSALEGLFFAVREELRECSARQEAFACEKCSLLEVQSHLDDKEVDEQARGPQKAEIVSKVGAGGRGWREISLSTSLFPAGACCLCVMYRGRGTGGLQLQAKADIDVTAGREASPPCWLRVCVSL